MAVAVIVIVVVAMAVLIDSCQSSQTENSLKNYAGTVSTLVNNSVNNGQGMFQLLEKSGGPSNASNLQGQMTNTYLSTARTNWLQAKALNAPSQMATAQRNLVTTMLLRYNGIKQIAESLPNALSQQGATDGVAGIATGVYMLSGSDVIYKTLVGPEIAGALHGDSIPVGGTSGVPIAGGQVVTDLSWLNKRDIAKWLAAPLPSTQVNVVTGGLQGHVLNGVSDGTTTLTSTGSNTIPASPPQTFTLNLTNGGTSDEYEVVCKVWVKGWQDEATTTIPETTPGETTTCNVTLPKSLPAGTPAQLYAEVEPVPGEKNVQDNIAVFPVTFN